MLDDLYWVMSYSRWKDERYWPSFRDALMREHPSLTTEGLKKRGSSIFNVTISRASAATRRRRLTRAALPILKVLTDLIPAGYMHGQQPTSVDAGIYGFIANIYFYAIETPLKQFVLSQQNLVRHCTAIHERVTQA